MKNKFLALLLCLSIAVFAEEKAPLPLPTTGNVTLTLAEYNRLVDLAAKSGRKSDLPPIPYTLKRADMKLRVAGGTVTGSLLMDGAVFSRNAAKVPLTTGVTILSAQQEGRSLPLEQEGTTSVAVLAGASDFSVTLETGLPLNIDAGRASFNLPVPAAGSVRLSLVIPGDHTNVRISPGLITSRTSGNGQTAIEATLVPNSNTNVYWTTRELTTPAVTKEVRFLSDVKTLVSVGEAEFKIAVLADITVVQGEPSQFVVDLPKGYEITGAAGATVESIGFPGNTLVLHLTSGTPRSHQFLISMERPLEGSAKADTPFLSFKDAQRETGEVLVEGTGAMELTATEGGGLKRLDMKEISPYLRGLSRFPMQAAFRYHRQPAETPSLAMQWVRFPDSNVLAAVAERAMVTTLVTTEGRSLTEVKLTVRNQAQPFLKVGLPAGTNILTAEVGGEKVKPVQGADGIRVPLLRPGFRPPDAYEVSFVFMHSGAPFARKGGSDLSLPSMDIPISVMQWELFLPEQYKVKDFGGDVIEARLLPTSGQVVNMVTKSGTVSVTGAAPLIETSQGQITNTFSGTTLSTFAAIAENEGLDTLALFTPGVVNLDSLQPGEIGGFIVDPQGAVIPGAQVIVRSDSGIIRQTVTDEAGRWVVSGVPAGRARIEASVNGFRTAEATINHDASKPAHYSFNLSLASVSETVTVEVNGKDEKRRSESIERDLAKNQAAMQNNASANVLNLQRRVAGVLPVRIEVPHAGTSYRFVRPLVLDEETKVTFNYKSK